MQRQEMNRHVGIAIKWLWSGCSLAVLFATLYFYDGKPNSDADVLLAYGMLFLSFPTGVLLASVTGLFGYLAYTVYGYTVLTSYWSISITWFFFFAVGYYQWFKLVPWLWRKWKTRRIL
jgi:hypothetical protein